MSGVLQAGLDYATNAVHPINCSSTGQLEARCLGKDAGGNQVQLKTEADGSLHVITENADSVLIKGIETGTTTQRDCKQNANGDLRVQLIANDGNDGAGTMRIVKCDANGVLDTAGGGGTADSTAANQVLQLAQETTTATKTTAVALSVASMDGKITACDTSGLAAETTLAAAEVHLGTIDTNIASVDGKITACDTGAVVVSSSALPTGAATAANQATGNTSLASLAGCVAGTELQVDIVSGGGGGTQFAVGGALGATPTGTLLIGRDGSGNADDVLITNSNELRVADTTAQTSLSTLAGAVAGSEVQCDIVSAGGIATETTLAAAEVHLGAIDTNISSIQSTVAQSTNQLLTFKSDIVVAASTAVADGATANGDLDLGTSLKVGGSPKEIYIETTMSPAVSASITVYYSVDNTNWVTGLSFAPEFIASTYNLIQMTTMTGGGGGSAEFIPPRYLRFLFANNDGGGQSTDIKMTCHYVG